MINPAGILMIEPKGRKSTTPVIDVLTRKMTAAWRKRKTSKNCYLGFHVCQCGACSDNHDHLVDGILTNSLCIHYIAWHRTDVPQAELDKVAALQYGEETPTPQELAQVSLRR